MSLICNGVLIIDCNSCHHRITIDCNDLSWYTDGNDMSGEKHHYVEHIINCPNCNSEITVKYDVYEKSIGIKNYQNIVVIGGTVVQECNINIQSE